MGLAVSAYTCCYSIHCIQCILVAIASMSAMTKRHGLTLRLPCRCQHTQVLLATAAKTSHQMEARAGAVSNRRAGASALHHG